MEGKASTCSNFTVHSERPRQLLRDLFTDRQSQAGTQTISRGVFVELAKIHEEVFDSLLRDTTPWVDDANLEADIYIMGDFYGL